MTGADAVTGVRGSVLALLSALVTAAGHQTGGGTLPDLALLVVLLPLLCGSSRRWPPSRSAGVPR